MDGGSDRLPLSCFRLRDQRFTVQGRSQAARPQAEPQAPVALALLPDKPALRLILIAPTPSRCPLHPHAAQT